MQCDAMEGHGMEITLEKETKEEKMLSYPSTSFSLASREKREEDVQMSIQASSIPRQNNPKGGYHIANINSTGTTDNSKSGDPCSSNSIRSCPTSTTATNFTKSFPLHNSKETKEETLTRNNAHSHATFLQPRPDSRTSTKPSQTFRKGDSNQMSLSLLELAWEDILFSNVFVFLTWKDLFHLRAVSHKAMDMIEHFFHKVKLLDLSVYSSVFTLDAFQVIASRSSNIRAIILSNCRFIKDSSLTTVFKNNRLITHVDLSGCTNLTGSCVLALAVNCKQIKILKLRECNWLSSGAVDTLIFHLQQIEEIDFSSCSALSDQQFIPLAQAYPGLKKIHLGHIHTVNDATLVAFSRNCPNLQTLDIQACVSVTDHGIRSIGEYCKNLKELFVARCHLVTENSLSLVRRRPVLIDRPNSGLLAIRWPVPRLQV